MPDLEPSRPSTWKLVRVPAAITLAVTALRLVGELLQWSPALFSRAPGGGGALVGISWLAPLFAIYFGIRLAAADQGPRRALRDLGLLLLAIALAPLAGFAAMKAGVASSGLALVFGVAAIVGVLVCLATWGELVRALLVYAFAARIPVAVLMLVAILGNWGTHYDVAPPGMAAMGPLRKWLLIGLLPQMTVWIYYTVAFGGLFGLVAGAIVRWRRKSAASRAAA